MSGDIEQAVCWTIRQDPSVAALAAGRVYPVAMPQRTEYPCVSYAVVSRTRLRVFGGVGGMCASRIQVDSWDATYAGAKALAAAVRGALDTFHGGMSPRTVGVCELLTEADVYEEDAEVYRVIQDFRILHDE